MRLADVRRGALYLDTNVLYMTLRPDPNLRGDLTVFMQRIAAGEIEAFAGILTFDELYYRLLLARIKDSTRGSPLDRLRADTAEMIANHAGAVEVAIRRLSALPHLTIVGIESTDLDQMLTNIHQFSILPRDALHVALMQRLGLTEIASDDSDFDRVAGLTRHWLINPPMT